MCRPGTCLYVCLFSCLFLFMMNLIAWPKSVYSQGNYHIYLDLNVGSTPTGE